MRTRYPRDTEEGAGLLRSARKAADVPFLRFGRCSRSVATELLDERLVTARVPLATEEVAGTWTLDLLGLPSRMFLTPGNNRPPIPA